MVLVNIESPYASKKINPYMNNKKNKLERKKEIEKNLQYARKCMHDCLKRGEAPLASHTTRLWKTQLEILDEEERKLGIQAGFEWNQVAEKTVVYTDLGISEGMMEGIEEARKKGRTIEYRELIEWQ